MPLVVEGVALDGSLRGRSLALLVRLIVGGGHGVLMGVQEV